MLGHAVPGGRVLAGTAAAFAVPVVVAITCASLLGLLPHRIVQIAVAVAVLFPPSAGATKVA